MQAMTIYRTDNRVGIDGVFYNVDCSSLSPEIHGVVWFGDTNDGHIEWADVRGKPKKSNTKIKSLDQFQTVIDLWNDIHATQLAATAAEQAISLVRQEAMATSGLNVNLSKV